MSSPAKVLAINFGGIGDEVLFLPTLERIKELAPGCELTLLVEPRSKSVMEVTNLIDKIITFDIKKRPLTPFALIALTMLLRKGGYDMVISSGSSPMVAMLLLLSGIKLRIGYDAGSPVKSLLTHPVKLLREQYAADMYHDLTKGMANYLRRKANPNASIRDADETYQVPKVTLKADSVKAMKEFLEEGLRQTVTIDSTDARPVKTVLIHPGTSRMAVSKGIIKHWSSENWLTFIRLLQNQEDQPFQTRVVLCGGPDDKEVVEKLERLLKEDAKQARVAAGKSANDPEAKFGHAPTYISAVGKTKGLADLAALTNICDVLVCVDSAPMHIGVGLNKKIVALFGPTDPKLLIPNQKNFKVLADRPEFASVNDALLEQFEGANAALAAACARWKPGDSNAGGAGGAGGAAAAGANEQVSVGSNEKPTQEPREETPEDVAAKVAAIEQMEPMSAERKALLAEVRTLENRLKPMQKLYGVADAENDKAAAKSKPCTAKSPQRKIQDGLGVRLAPGVIYQATMDLLRAD